MTDEKRFEAIINALDHVEGKTLIDIGCGNGFFIREFVKKGIRRFVGVDPAYPEFDIAFDSIGCCPFDIGLYLNLHYIHGTDDQIYPEWLSRHCDVVFTSCRKGGPNENNKYYNRIRPLFKNIEIIFDETNDHPKPEVIYRCTQ